MTSHVVFGGCGFLGRHLVRSLAANGADVTAVDINAFPATAHSIRTLRIDVSNATAADFDALVGNADVVHHYAWTTIPALANADPMADLQANLQITLGLLDALKRRGGGKLVFASSGGTVYGRLNQVPVPEEHALEPITAYGVSKVSAEKYLQFYRYLHGVDARVARIANPYGAGQNPARQQGAVTTFVHRALAGETIEIWGDGEVVRDFIHIADLVPALFAIAEQPFNANQPMPIFNIGSGSRHTLNDIVQSIEQNIGGALSVERKPTRAFDVPVSVLDITKAMRELQWRPRIDLHAGIGRMIDDLKADPARQFSS